MAAIQPQNSPEEFVANEHDNATRSGADVSPATSEAFRPDEQERSGSEDPERTGRPQVRFTAGGEAVDEHNVRSTFEIRGTSQSPTRERRPSQSGVWARLGRLFSRNASTGGASPTRRPTPGDAPDTTESYSLSNLSGGRAPDDVESDGEEPRDGTSEAHRLVREHTNRRGGDPEARPAPNPNQGGILWTLLRLYDVDGLGAALGGPANAGVRWRNGRPVGPEVAGRTPTPGATPPTSGGGTPRSGRQWWRRSSWGKPRLEDEIGITIHLAHRINRQHFLVRLCRALMMYGAPTHRLEEYMRMAARVLEVNSQYLYIPGCMIISFDDRATHTTEVRLVRATQAVDLAKLRDVHDIYKNVLHDACGVDEASADLDEIMARGPRYPPWVLVIVYGLASAFVGPFAFGARWPDLPVAFLLGCILGVLQLILAPRSDLYSNVFEITAAVLTSFLARAFGSIYGGGVFCFPALAQSSIALILPGYTVLCGSLELQSRSIISGSVRMVYAIIYSLFLGFGITIGTAIYGLMDPMATSEVTCPHAIPSYYSFLFVPAFTICLIVINQARWGQAPMMVAISFAGYVVNFFSAKRFAANAQIANTLGAFTIGVLGNLYSRLQHGVAATALIPAIFVQVPSGLAAGGSLITGIISANQITHGNGTSGVTTVTNATQAIDVRVNTAVFNLAYSMIEIAIGITVGLFLSALVIYPFGKKRSGLFSF